MLGYWIAWDYVSDVIRHKLRTTKRLLPALREGNLAAMETLGRINELEMTSDQAIEMAVMKVVA